MGNTFDPDMPASQSNISGAFRLVFIIADSYDLIARPEGRALLGSNPSAEAGLEAGGIVVADGVPCSFSP
jgi:hypothetical protein